MTPEALLLVGFSAHSEMWLLGNGVDTVQDQATVQEQASGYTP